MPRPASSSMTITVRGQVCHITMELDGYTKSVKAPEDLWELQEVLVTYRPRDIFLDLHLPITFGVQLLEVLRQTYPEVPIRTKVESNLSGSHYFSIEAQKRGIVLRPISPGSGGSFSAPAEKE